MADDRKEQPPAPSRAEKGKAKIGEPIEEKHEEYVPEEIAPAPDPEPGDADPGDSNDPKNAPRDGEMVLKKVLMAREVDPSDPVLFLDAYEAYLLTINDTFMEPPSASFSMSISVFDGGCDIYNMLISYCTCGNWVGYSVTRDWAQFVKSHDMKTGDTIFFYRVVNPDVMEDCYFYEIRYTRAAPIRVEYSRDTGSAHIDTEPISNLLLDDTELYEYLNKTHGTEPQPDPGQELEKGLESLDLNWQQSPEPGPGSRDMPDEGICLSKTLSELEVPNKDGHPRLIMTAHEACLFIRCPNIAEKYTLGNLSLNLVVFDAEDEQYDMLLCHLNSPDNGGLIYTLDAGWQRFMKHHNLQAGDEVCFYRLTDENINKGRVYYAMRWKRMSETLPPVSESVPTGGLGPAGGGTTEAEPSGCSGQGAGPSGIGSTEVGPSGGSSEGAGPSGVGSAGVGPSGGSAGPCGVGSTEVGPSGGSVEGVGTSGGSGEGLGPMGPPMAEH